MMFARVVFITCLLAIADLEYVWNKNCRDVDVSQCTVHSVIVDPCSQGSSFCIIKINKNYEMTINMTPKFAASKLKLAIYGDVLNNGTFTTIFLEPIDGCGFLYCPLQAEETRIFDARLVLNKSAHGKFPVQVKLWNEADNKNACCFTFTVKVK